MNQDIPVNKPSLPSKNKLKKMIDLIYSSGTITNNGSLVQNLEHRLEQYLGVRNLVLVANGTIALQLATKILNIKKKVITTPFSFVATTSALAWDSLEISFCDINENTFNLSPFLLRDIISSDIGALLPVHVFGNPCDVEQLEDISRDYGIPIIYDAAHAFNIKYKNKSILNYGDISILSLHATKLFHTIEGGALIIRDDNLYNNAKMMRNFGYEKGVIRCLGINAKMNELQAAVGLLLLENIDRIITKKRFLWETYHSELKDLLQTQQRLTFSTNNYQYFPVLFQNEKALLKTTQILHDNKIYPRRYFSPSLDELPYICHKPCEISRDISRRILCLPLFETLSCSDQTKIIEIIKKSLN